MHQEEATNREEASMVPLPLRTNGMPKVVASLGLSASPATQPEKEQPDAAADPLRPAHAGA